MKQVWIFLLAGGLAIGAGVSWYFHPDKTVTVVKREFVQGPETVVYKEGLQTIKYVNKFFRDTVFVGYVPGAVSGEFFKEFVVDSGKCNLQIGVKTYPKADSVKFDYSLSYLEKNVLRVDTLVSTRVDTAKVEVTVRGPWYERPEYVGPAAFILGFLLRGVSQ